jgi:hypothetical protein
MEEVAAYAQLVWQCSRCNGEPIEQDDGTLLCETDGIRFEVTGMYRATALPDVEGDL